MIAKLTYLWCDVLDCDEEAGPCNSAPEVRREALRSGWTVNRHGHGRDLCPTHSRRATGGPDV